MSRNIIASCAFVAAATVLGSTPIMAQRSQDTLRYAINDMFPTVDPYVFSQDEAGVVTRVVYQPLIAYQEGSKKYVPQLAKSWTIPRPGVYEFDLRDDVVFHSGNKFTADDVVYTLSFFADPKVNVRFKNHYDWIAKVEKLGAHKVRIVSKEPSPFDMQELAYRNRILDSQIHKGLANFEDYGRASASGTGAYKVTSLDRDKIVLDRHDAFKDDYQRAVVKRYVGLHIGDEQSRIAQLLTGGVDALRNITSDNATSISKVANLTIADIPSGDEVYITLDAAGRSKNKLMTDQRVRKALMMAINRDELIKHIIPGHGTAKKMSSVCFEWTADCAFSTEPPAYDPAGAKKLLAEAGFPNGVDLVLDAHDPVRSIAEAIAGELRKVGFRTTVNPMPISVYIKRRGEGELTAFLGFYPTSAQPDGGSIYNFFFGAERDYYRDQDLHRAGQAGVKEFDQDKRTAYFREVVDRANRMNYILPISSLPTAYAMSKDVKIVPDAFSYASVYLNDIVWADYTGK